MAKYKLSEKVRVAILLSKLPQYQYAASLGVDGSWLSQRLNGQASIRKDDPRVKKLARLVDLPLSDCLERINPREIEKEILEDVPTHYTKGDASRAWAKERKCNDD